MAEAAEAWNMDRTTILRIRTVAKQGPLDALAAPRPGVMAARRDVELDQPVPTRRASARQSRGWRSSPPHGYLNPPPQVVDPALQITARRSFPHIIAAGLSRRIPRVDAGLPHPRVDRLPDIRQRATSRCAPCVGRHCDSLRPAGVLIG